MMDCLTCRKPVSEVHIVFFTDGFVRARYCFDCGEARFLLAHGITPSLFSPGECRRCGREGDLYSLPQRRGQNALCAQCARESI